MNISIILKQCFGLISMALAMLLIFMAIPFQIFISRKPFEWKFLFGCIIALLIFRYGWKWFRNYYDLNEIPFEPGNIYAEKARSMAKAELEIFIKLLENGKNDCYVKAGLKTVRGGIEHIWCTAHRLDNGEIWCSLANQPLELEGQYLNDRFVVPVNEIEDYVVTKDDENIGGYSLMASAETLRSRGYRIRPDQMKIIKRHTAYKKWDFENPL